MPDFVYDIPTPQLALWFSAVAIAAVVVGLFVVKPFFRLLIGTGPDFNATVSYVTSGFAIFYGLLLGLLTVAAYQNLDRVRESIVTEATSLGALYGQLAAYPEPTRSDLREMVRDYVQFTIQKEWPAHREGKILNGGYNRVDAVHKKLVRFEPTTESERILHASLLGSFEEFTAARQRRLAGVNTAIPDVLWYAVLVGAVISVLITVLMRLPLHQHFVLGSLSTFFLGVILFVIVTLDRPLSGESGIGPDPLRLMWDRSMVWDEPRY